MFGVGARAPAGLSTVAPSLKNEGQFLPRPTTTLRLAQQEGRQATSHLFKEHTPAHRTDPLRRQDLAAAASFLLQRELGPLSVMSFNMKKAGEKLKISAGVAGDKMRILSQTMKEKTSNVPVSDTINPEIVQLHNVLLPFALFPFRSFIFLFIL